MERLLTGVGVVVTVACICIYVAAAGQTAQVNLEDGAIQGRIVDSAQGEPVQEYLGIPYGEPPIGDLRYADPKPVKPWTGIKTTQKFGHSCYQILDLTFGRFPGSNMWNAPNKLDEDCLYLNVWTPHPRPENATVMVWIFGGGFYSGTSALAVYDGKTLAAFANVIVVSMNYRVGSFGFLSTGDGRIKGNFGLKDQQLSLQWIQKNIAQFGGNPKKVTIMGESAGAASVGFHMMSQGSDKLFHRGIMQSGAPDAHWAFMTPETAKERSDKFLEAVKCSNESDVLQCLRKPSLTPKTILDNEWVDGRFLVFPWAPTIDGTFLRDSPSNFIKQKKLKKVHLLLGTNKNEGTFWILYAVPTYSKDNASPQTWNETLAALDITEYDLSRETKHMLVHLYTFGKGKLNGFTNRDMIDDVVGDRSFICPTMAFARANVNERKKTYVYRLEQRASTEVWPNWMGVIHGADIQWVFGVPLNASAGYKEADVALSKEIMTYWSRFAKHGTPNGHNKNAKPKLMTWPLFNRHEQYIEFQAGAKSVIKAEVRHPYCDFWDLVQKLQLEGKKV